MQLVCLGTTGFHPNADRHTACYLVREAGVVLDAGTGLFRLADHLATDRVDVFLSHAHLDHVAGLTYLIEPFGVEAHDKVTIWGEEDKLAAIREHLFAPAIFPVMPRYRYETVRQTCPLPGGGTMRTFPLIHPGGGIGMRLEWPGHSMAYVTDTTADPGADYVAHLQGVDLLVHESNFPDGQDEIAQLTGHSCLNDVARVAAAAGVGRLLVCHCDPFLTKHGDFDLTDAKKIYPAIEIARDLDVVEF